MALSQSVASELLEAFRAGEGVDLIRESPTAGHLAAYAGLAPVTRQSGISIRGEHHRAAATSTSNARCS